MQSAAELALVPGADTALFPRYASTMRKLLSTVGMLCVVIFFPLTLSAQQATTVPVVIRVSDQAGASIAHAHIRIMPGPDPAPAKLETDDHGELSVSLKVGGYSISVTAPGFEAGNQHLDISGPAGKASASQTILVVLQVAALDGMIVYSSDALVISADQQHVAFSPTDFRALPHITVAVHNGHTNAAETYSGVPLATLLAKVNAPQGKELRGKAMMSYLVATGSDGYSVVFSLAEVDPDFHQGQVLVADTRDGQPLGKSGPFQLIVSDDKRPARWVHNLVSITLQKSH
jgi:hypothetical protein